MGGLSAEAAPVETGAHVPKGTGGTVFPAEAELLSIGDDEGVLTLWATHESGRRAAMTGGACVAF
jgi:hypothetical protein